jgi:hypothetical protein
MILDYSPETVNLYKKASLYRKVDHAPCLSGPSAISPGHPPLTGTDGAD